MKIQVLQHDPAARLPQRKGDPAPLARNLDPLQHPFARARERSRALAAAKMDRMFARPFVDAFSGHMDAIEVMVRKPGTLSEVASGSWDGGIIVHNLSKRNKSLNLQEAHKGKVSGLCYADGGRLLSCGVDKNIKMWDASVDESLDENGAGPSSRQPLNVFPGKSVFNSIDHHRSEPLFSTASSTVQVWDETRTAPIANLSFPASTETITSVRFNPSESSVLASVGSDRTCTLYDVRTGKAERRTVMQMKSNGLSWCPTFPTVLLLASEDHNLYTFDIRSMSNPTQIYKAHVAAVTSCDWSSTGKSFVSGGWDRTIRIWEEGRGTKPEVYHTKRMQRVASVLFTSDTRFVLSGSDDGIMRLWKARAADKLGIINARERAAIEYRAALRKRWHADSEIGRIERTRHVPKPMHQADKLKHTMLDARRVKEERRRKHTRAGEKKPKDERKKVVLVEQS